VNEVTQVELKKISLGNGETLGYREREGGEKVLLLVHGNMTSSKHWDVLIEGLSPDFKVYALDLRGFGISSYNTPISSIKDFSEDIKLFVDALQLQSFSLMGWSTGGAIAMQFASDYPKQVQKLLLLASASTRGYPFYKADAKGKPILKERMTTIEDIKQDRARTIPIQKAYQTRDKDRLRMIWDAVIYTHKKPTAAQYEDYLEDMLTQRNLPEVYQALNTFNISKHYNGLLEGTGEAERIKVPTRVLQGTRDLVVPEKMALEIIQDLGEEAELVYLENCGHSPLIDDLTQLIEKVESFLRK
jgi:pimeloyl-ACP methyl ester carboxylesterase